MIDLKSMTLEELTAWLQEQGEPAFRGKQVFRWFYRGATSFGEMSDLSKPLRQKLEEQCFLSKPKVARKQVSALDGTIKYLWELADGNCIETVLMRYKHGNTVCISCQVGCRMGCAFCASTLAGKVRDLTPAEMVDQVLFTQIDSGEPISNIVLMGIGEPLDNYDTVMKFLTLVNHPDGLNIGMRHISLSTCGLVDKIDKLAQQWVTINTIRFPSTRPMTRRGRKSCQINRGIGVERLMDCCRRYFQTTGRRISYEYAMIDGVNDSDQQAEPGCQPAEGNTRSCESNSSQRRGGESSETKQASGGFPEAAGEPGGYRHRPAQAGGDIDASCGQLRRKAMREEN